jgi:hypothetical protein
VCVCASVYVVCKYLLSTCFVYFLFYFLGLAIIMVVLVASRMIRGL